MVNFKSLAQYINALYYHQTNKIKCTLELLRVISKSGFIVRKSFNNEASANDTTLSKYIWELKETSNSNPTLVWSIAKKVPPYSNTSEKCLLCLHEKLEIIILDQRNCLTKDMN